MNSKTLLKCLCMCLAMFAILVNANAQDLKSILTGVAKAVVGDKATTSSFYYRYLEICRLLQCQFESENLLAKGRWRSSGERSGGEDCRLSMTE